MRSITSTNFNSETTEATTYNLSLSGPFNSSTNITALFGRMSKTGSFASNNIAPNYVDGTMFANDDEFILYGYVGLSIDPLLGDGANQN
jgi:hypothetical protein